MTRFVPHASLEVPVSLDCLTDVRHFLRGGVAGAGLDEEQVALLEIAVIESVTNVVRHAKSVPPGECIHVGWRAETARFQCSVVYAGDRYEPPADEVDMPTFEDFPEGGFGNFIIMNACDAVHFDYINGRNVVTLEVVPKAPH